MRACRAVAGLALLLLLCEVGADVSGRTVNEAKLGANLMRWIELQKFVHDHLRDKHNASSPFDNEGFFSAPNASSGRGPDGTAVILSARNIFPDITLTTAFQNDDQCREHFPPPDGYRRDAVPLFSIVIIPRVKNGNQALQKFRPYLCAQRRQTQIMVFINISNSYVAPPLGDICSTMILIRQSLHSARFLVTLLTEKVPGYGLCRPIVWGNLSPYLQIRREPFEANVFLATKSGSITFIINDEVLKQQDNATETQRVMGNLYATMDNVVQLSLRSYRIAENFITGPRFATSSVPDLKLSYLAKRKHLTQFITDEGNDLTDILILSMLPVLLFAGTVTTYILVNPQFVRWSNKYERVTEAITTEDGSSKQAKKTGFLEAIKGALPRKRTSNTNKSASIGRRKTKKKRSSGETATDKTKTIAEKTAEVSSDGEMTATAGLTSGKTTKRSKGSGGLFAKKKLMRKSFGRNKKTQDKTSGSAVRAENGRHNGRNGGDRWSDGDRPGNCVIAEKRLEMIA